MVRKKIVILVIKIIDRSWVNIYFSWENAVLGPYSMLKKFSAVGAVFLGFISGNAHSADGHRSQTPSTIQTPSAKQISRTRTALQMSVQRSTGSLRCADIGSTAPATLRQLPVLRHVQVQLQFAKGQQPGTRVAQLVEKQQPGTRVAQLTGNQKQPGTSEAPISSVRLSPKLVASLESPNPVANRLIENILQDFLRRTGQIARHQVQKINKMIADLRDRNASNDMGRHEHPPGIDDMQRQILEVILRHYQRVDFAMDLVSQPEWTPRTLPAEEIPNRSLQGFGINQPHSLTAPSSVSGELKDRVKFLLGAIASSLSQAENEFGKLRVKLSSDDFTSALIPEDPSGNLAGKKSVRPLNHESGHQPNKVAENEFDSLEQKSLALHYDVLRQKLLKIAYVWARNESRLLIDYRSENGGQKEDGLKEDGQKENGQKENRRQENWQVDETFVLQDGVRLLKFHERFDEGVEQVDFVYFNLRMRVLEKIMGDLQDLSLKEITDYYQAVSQASFPFVVADTNMHSSIDQLVQIFSYDMNVTRKIENTFGQRFNRLLPY